MKSTIWYIRSGKTFAEGFKYLIDLFESGFIIDPNEFVRAGIILLELYSKANDPNDVIKRLSIDKDPGTIEGMMESIQTIITKREVNDEKIREIFGILIKITYDKLGTARTIDSLGEWVLVWARWYGLVLLVQQIKRAYKSNLRLGIAEETILSPLEEFKADVGSLRDRLAVPRYYPFTDMPGAIEFPLPINFTYVFMLFMQYKEKYAEDAVNKLLQDRCMPGYFRSILDYLNGKKDAIPDLTSPWADEALYLPVSFAFPMGCITDIEPTMMRMELLPKHLLVKEDEKANGRSKPSKRQIDQLYQEYTSIFPQFKEVKRDSQGVYFARVKRTPKIQKAQEELEDIMYQLHLKACVSELEELISKYETRADTLDQRELQDRKVTFEKILKMYPWFPFAYQELCIINDRMGDGLAAKQNIQAGLLLDLTNPSIWQSFKVICNRYSTKQDAIIAGAIADTLASKTTNFSSGAG